MSGVRFAGWHGSAHSRKDTGSIIALRRSLELTRAGKITGALNGESSAITGSVVLAAEVEFRPDGGGEFLFPVT